MTIVSVSSATALEGNNIVFTVSLDQPALGTETVRFRVLSGNGLGTAFISDRSFEVQQLTFAPGETTKTITVPTGFDSLDEIDQNFTLELFDPVNAELAGGGPALRAMGIILDNDGSGSNLAVFVGSPIIYENDTGNTVARFEVRLSVPNTAALSLAFTTIDGSAVAGQDYTATSGTLNIAAGQVVGFVDVPVLGDRTIEATEAFFLRITPPAAAPSTAGAVGIATILNDDTLVNQPSISVSSYGAVEGGSVAFTVTLDQPSAAAVTVNFRVLSGNGLGTAFISDRSFEVQQLTFAPGETTKTITVPTGSDSLDEVDQNFTLELFDPVNAELAGGGPALRAMGIVLDNDGSGSNLAVFVGSPIIYENDTGNTVARFEVRLSQPNTAALSLAFTTIDGSAVAGQDYTATSGTLNIAAGQVVGFVDVPVLGDRTIEATEAFFLRITPPAAAPSTAGAVGIATILNDDALVNQPAISVSSYGAVEGDSVAFTVTLDQPSAAAVTVNFRVVSGNGLGTAFISDRSFEVQQLTFAPGETTKTITVPTGSDSLDEIDQNFTLELFDPVNAELAGGGPALRAMGIVLDNDGSGSNLAVFVGSPIIYENDTGNTVARFEVRLSQPNTAALSLAFTTIDGSAVAGQDYTATSGTLNIAAGQVVGFVDVPVLGDRTIEATEAFFLRITPPAAAPSTTGAVGIATILNDDTLVNQPAISVSSYGAVEGGSVAFTVTLDQPSAAAVTVNFRVLSGNGLGTAFISDRSFEVQQLTFAPGETTKTITVPTGSDSLDEVDQNFTLELFDPVNAELAGGGPALRAMGIVLDNDGSGSNLAVFVGSPIIYENDTGNTVARFEVRLSQPNTAALSLAFTTIDGSAVAGQDYTATSGTLNIAAGQVVGFVDVPVLGDRTIEATEAFFLRITPPAAAPSTAGPWALQQFSTMTPSSINRRSPSAATRSGRR